MSELEPEEEDEDCCLPGFGSVRPMTPMIFRSWRRSERSSARADPMALRSAQRDPVGIDT